MKTLIVFFTIILLVSGVSRAGMINGGVLPIARIEHQPRQIEENQKKIKRLDSEINLYWTKEQRSLQIKEAERLWNDLISQRNLLFKQMSRVVNPQKEEDYLKKIKQQLRFSEYFKYKLREFYDRLYPLSQTREEARIILQEQARLLTNQIFRAYSIKDWLEEDLSKRKEIERQWQERRLEEDWIRRELGRDYLGPIGQGLLWELLEERQEQELQKRLLEVPSLLP